MSHGNRQERAHHDKTKQATEPDLSMTLILELLEQGLKNYND